MAMWSQSAYDLLPEWLLLCSCCSGQPRPALPQERDFTVKTPAVSAGCLQYKHSQGSQREVGWLWEHIGPGDNVGQLQGQGDGSGEADSFGSVSCREDRGRASLSKAVYRLRKAQITSMWWCAAASSASLKQAFFTALASPRCLTSFD